MPCFTFERYTGSDKFFVEPLDSDSLSAKILEIDRVTQELNLTGMLAIFTTKHVSRKF